MSRVMIIDDDKLFVEEAAETLKLSGYKVHLFTDAEEALAQIGGIMPAAVLVDLKMSPVSGFKFTAELRKLPKLANIPVIGMTGFYANDEHRPLIRICGIEKCLIKPIQPLDIIAALEEAIKGDDSSK
ncbi:MAG: hypothetical protein COV72_04690 [Candidatus Omnitrophica bacterium CG11_big_fil_rev_8_21_14_0_20_42_13]|uniref:Response regulatory domain-containing protein n=1 Tax=Candidatus Ghiorseimicrobium undicola TaxID=1974746 RepID=A0A2H0M036_9BACT|nr:MAG: hypothetical protein COV72_04690 [Candidatus Omnitrophica bacterium CG11_big_fil_rev_8_21_14_0_20_42_13]